MLSIPRADLGLGDPSRPIDLERDGEVDELMVNGDSAPNGRFNYVYHATR